MRIHLVAYGDENYKKQRQVFKESARKSNYFDEMHLFTDRDIDPIFRKNVYEPIKHFRGGGYWIWKPYFIKKVLDEIDEGDALIYIDSGCLVNSYGRARFEDYKVMLNESPTGTIDFGLQWMEFQYTKRETFEYFQCSQDIINSNQLHATVIILKKCSHSQMLVNKWHAVAVSNPFQFTDEKILPQHPRFRDHRHDQSIFSIIRKTYGANIIYDETCYYDFKTGEKFPFWAMRLKDKDY